MAQFMLTCNERDIIAEWFNIYQQVSQNADPPVQTGLVEEQSILFKMNTAGETPIEFTSYEIGLIQQWLHAVRKSRPPLTHKEEELAERIV